MNLKNSTFEWMCSGGEPTGRKFVRLAAQWGCILFGLMSIFFLFFIPFVLVTVACGVTWFLLARRKKTEYEFDYMMGELTVFRISNNVRRKKRYHCTLDEISYMVKGINNHNDTLSFYFNQEEAYTMQVNNSAGLKNILLEADERFIQILDQEHKLRK